MSDGIGENIDLTKIKSILIRQKKMYELCEIVRPISALSCTWDQGSTNEKSSEPISERGCLALPFLMKFDDLAANMQIFEGEFPNVKNIAASSVLIAVLLQWSQFIRQM